MQGRSIEHFESHASGLRAAYWRIRAERSANRRRKWYRRAAKEKGRLAALGYDPEVIRLYGLALRDLRREDRMQRFYKSFDEALKAPEQLCLF